MNITKTINVFKLELKEILFKIIKIKRLIRKLNDNEIIHIIVSNK